MRNLRCLPEHSSALQSWNLVAADWYELIAAIPSVCLMATVRSVVKGCIVHS